MLDARLPRLEELASVEASDSGSSSAVFPTAGARWLPRRGVCSSGMVGIVVVIVMFLVGGRYEKKRGRGGDGGRGKRMGAVQTLVRVFLSH
jgi:hypothetical protein